MTTSSSQILSALPSIKIELIRHLARQMVKWATFEGGITISDLSRLAREKRLSFGQPCAPNDVRRVRPALAPKLAFAINLARVYPEVSQADFRWIRAQPDVFDLSNIEKLVPPSEFEFNEIITHVIYLSGIKNDMRNRDDPSKMRYESDIHDRAKFPAFIQLDPVDRLTIGFMLESLYPEPFDFDLCETLPPDEALQGLTPKNVSAAFAKPDAVQAIAELNRLTRSGR